MQNRIEIPVFTPQLDQYYSPVATSPEHVINSQVPLLDDILERVLEQLGLQLHLQLQLQFAGTVDVLNPHDYPLAYKIARGFLRAQSTLHKQHSFPRKSHLGNNIQRELFTPKELLNGRKFVQSSSRYPLCYRYIMEITGKYLGDIFVIPILTQRTAGETVEDKVKKNAYETLILGVDCRSRNVRKYKPDLIFTDDGYHDEDETEYFIVISDGPLNQPELSGVLGRQIERTLMHWQKGHNKRSRKSMVIY